MKRTNIQYGLPILAFDRTDYKKNKCFKISSSGIVNSEENFSFELCCDLKSRHLLSLIQNKDAEIIYYITTKENRYFYKGDLGKNKIELKYNNFDRKAGNPIKIKAYILATTEKEVNYNNEFASNYNDIAFLQNKHDILAYSNELPIYFKDDDISSLIFVEEKADETAPFEVDLENDCIIIKVTKDINKFYSQTLDTKPNYLGFLFAYIGISRAIAELKDEHSIYLNKKWYKTINEFFTARGISVIDFNIDELTHKILKNMFTETIQELNKILRSE